MTVKVPDDWEQHRCGWARSEACSCGYCYRTSEHGWQKCPRCFPEQERPLLELVSDPEAHMGPEWAWMEWRGPRGQWVPLRTLVCMDRQEWDRLCEVIRENVPPAVQRETEGSTLDEVLRRSFKALRDGAA